jgi:1,4-dihydroxy-2-naphthoyl-CoA hydrolase
MPENAPKDRTAALNAHRAAFDVAMGFRYVRATADEVVMEYEIGPHHRQPYGIVHGGVHCAIVESACSAGAGLVALARGQAVVGVENHTSFIHAVRAGIVTVRAVPLSRGRRSQVWEATSRDADGRVIATGRVRLLCLDAGTDLAGASVGTHTVDPFVTDEKKA